MGMCATVAHFWALLVRCFGLLGFGRVFGEKWVLDCLSLHGMIGV